jgi:hypothetical protein
MLTYKGTIEIIKCDRTHCTSIIPFTFEDKNVLTRDLVTARVCSLLTKQKVKFYGVLCVSYDYCLKED